MLPIFLGIEPLGRNKLPDANHPSVCCRDAKAICMQNQAKNILRRIYYAVGITLGLFLSQVATVLAAQESRKYQDIWDMLYTNL